MPSPGSKKDGEPEVIPEKKIVKPLDNNLYTYTKPNGNSIICFIVRIMFKQKNGVELVEVQNIKRPFIEERGQLTYYVSRDELTLVRTNILQKIRRLLKWN